MSQSDKNADLSGAIRELETLLDGHPDDEYGDGEELPLLDEIVDPDDPDAFVIDGAEGEFAVPAPAGETPRPDPAEIRALLDRIAAQMETELDQVVGLLKQNMLEEFRNELAAALDMDPQQLAPGSHQQGRDA